MTLAHKWMLNRSTAADHSGRTSVEHYPKHVSRPRMFQTSQARVTPLSSRLYDLDQPDWPLALQAGLSTWGANATIHLTSPFAPGVNTRKRRRRRGRGRPPLMHAGEYETPQSALF